MERRARHAATSRTIEKNAVALVLEHGFDHITVDMICEASGVSQRTFFNHFPTKLAAVVGREQPRIDESAVRRFLASGSDDLLADLLELVAELGPGGSDPELMPARFAIITSTPALMQAEMSRMLAVQRELGDVIALRLSRHSLPGESGDDIAAQARMLAHVVAGVMRYSIDAPGDGVPGAPDLDRARDVFRALLPKLA